MGAYIGAAYWFTSSTSFANPAVTIARTLSDSFAGIDPASAPQTLRFCFSKRDETLHEADRRLARLSVESR